MIPLLFSKSVYAKRREELAASLEPNRDLVVYYTAPFRYRNHDSSYRFRPDSSFYYLTGFAEPEATILLWREKKGGKSVTKLVAFVQPRDPAREQWDGFRYGVSRAKTLLDADAAHSSHNLEQGILEWLKTVPAPGVAPRVHTNAWAYPEHKMELDRVLDQFHPAHRSGKNPLASVEDVRPLVEAQRLIKTHDELEVMREAGRINVRAHLKAMHMLRPGIFEYEVQSVVEQEYIRNGCLDPAYTSICATGPNAAILHYIENTDRLKAGQLFLIDAGCEYKYFASDITRTIPVSGTYTRAQRNIMDIVMDAHSEAMRQARPGVKFTKLHEAATDALIDGLRSLKFLKGSLASIKKSLSYKRYYMHGTSHWLGHDVHDACPYIDSKGESLKLKPGMVFTIEPGLYFMANDRTVPAEYRGMGIRIEDDVVVTRSGKPEVLTSGLPRTASEIEAEMSSAKRLAT